MFFNFVFRGLKYIGFLQCEYIYNFSEQGLNLDIRFLQIIVILQKGIHELLKLIHYYLTNDLTYPSFWNQKPFQIDIAWESHFNVKRLILRRHKFLNFLLVVLFCADNALFRLHGVGHEFIVLLAYYFDSNLFERSFLVLLHFRYYFST